MKNELKKKLRVTTESFGIPSMNYERISNENGFSNVLTGKTKTAIVAVNDKGEYGFLPGEDHPYMPIGGALTLQSVKDILIYKPYKF